MNKIKKQKDQVSSKPESPKKISSAASERDVKGTPLRVQLTAARQHPLFLITGIGVLGIFVAWVGVSWMARSASKDFIPLSQEASATGPVNETPAPVITDVPRAIDGVTVPAEEQYPVLVGVVVENLYDRAVRPQSGLSNARIVYETLVEGRITRFFALFLGTDSSNAKEIGPVRSARPYYVDIAKEYQAVFDHAGGSPEGMAQIKKFGLRDMNAIGGASIYHWRDHSKSAPHNLYTSSEKLATFVRDKFGSDHSTFQGWKYTQPSALESRPQTPHFVHVNYSSAVYNPWFDYHRESNTYVRSHAGSDFVDKNNNEPVAVENVIIQFVPAEGYYPSGKGRLSINVTGEGKAIVARDGKAILATWKRKTLDDRTIYTDLTGHEMEFIPGKTWVVIVPGDREVIVEPSFEASVDAPAGSA
jgi:hypothetical protein